MIYNIGVIFEFCIKKSPAFKDIAIKYEKSPAPKNTEDNWSKN